MVRGGFVTFRVELSWPCDLEILEFLRIFEVVFDGFVRFEPFVDGFRAFLGFLEVAVLVFRFSLF